MIKQEIGETPEKEDPEQKVMSEALREMVANQEEQEKEKNVYNPIESVHRDFSSEWIHRDEKGETVVDDADLNVIFDFYRQEVQKGTLLDLGAGPTHLHYMGSVEDRVSHFTALDLSEKNIQALKEFLDGVSPATDEVKEKPKYVSEDDIKILKLTGEAQEVKRNKENPRTGEQVLESIREKSLAENGKEYDLVVGNYHDIDKIEALGERKFDNIIIGFALYANKEKEIPELFKKIKERLNPGGKIIVADIQGFTTEVEQEQEEFREDEIVEQLYPDFIDYSLKSLISALRKAGFPKKGIKAKEIISETEESPDGRFKYLFLSAEN
ncbi:MAG: class I SAM-dependent methyltransferase [Candidatus Staskawiczbacteria bacterium]|nr:class I SAM-dependent methyltransferase [Candidatus Staskawiczbacteria bacterium]